MKGPLIPSWLVSTICTWSVTASMACAQSVDTGELVDAVKKLQQKDSVVLLGEVAEPESDEDGFGPGGGVIIMMGGGNQTADYSGEIEVIVDPKNEELLIASKDALPGLAIYDNGYDMYQTLTFRDGKFAADNLANDVGQLLDLKNLAEYLSKAKNVVKSPKDKGATFKCTLSPRTIRPQSGGGIAARMMTAGIVEIQAELTIDANGNLTAMAFHVERENVMAKMMERAEGADVAGSDLDNLPEAAREQMEAQMSNPVVSYQFRIGNSPSDRAKNLLKQMRNLADDH